MSDHSTHVTEESKCSSLKIGYSSLKSANVEVRRIDDINVVAYKCPECGKYHVGNKFDSGNGRVEARKSRSVTDDPTHAGRAAEHLESLSTKEPDAKFKVISLPTLDIREIHVTVVGDSSLIVHKWSEKARRMMLDKQMGRASEGREFKVPEEDFRDSLYLYPGGGYAVPSLAFKNAAVTACTSLGKSITKVQARQAFHVKGEFVRVDGDEPIMRDDMVRVGMGTADVRFRGEFINWSCSFTVRYNARVLSAQQIVNIINTSGFAVGICEWRPECNGAHGMFHCE